MLPQPTTPRIIDRTPSNHKGTARVESTCLECGAAFLVPPCFKSNYVTCSDTCSRQRKRNQRLRRPGDCICQRCGVAFRRTVKGRIQQFCSNDCRLAALNSLPRPRATGVRIWRITPKGYVAGQAWIDGKRRSVFQHRWVMEQHLERRLAPSERIHHINGDRTDNRIENLRLYDSHREHMRAEHPTIWEKALDKARNVGQNLA